METWKQWSARLPAIFFALLVAVAVAAERREWEVPGEEGGGDLPLAGKAKIGWIHKDDLVARQLRTGDILRIPAGSTFYIVNTGEDQRLQIIASFDPVGTDLIADLFTPFYIGGGEYPRSVFAGFDISTLTSAFHATPGEVGVLTSARTDGSIIFITGNEANHLHQLTGAVMSAMEKLKRRRRLAQDDDEEIVMEEKKEKRKGGRTWKSILSSFFFGSAATEKNKNIDRVGDPVEAPDAYNIAKEIGY